MKITILAVGKKHDPKLELAIEEYMKRLKHYADVSWELAEAKLTSSMSPKEVKRVESELLSSKIREEDTVLVLDETGTQYNSIQFAEKIQQWQNQSTKRLVIIIGGAYGVDQTIMKRARSIWSLSSLVFPHQLVRLILVEQLYRAHTILAGERYHHQ